MEQNITNRDKIEKELKSAEELHRFEAGIMLGQNAVYLLVTGTLLNAATSKDAMLSSKIGVAIFGTLLSLAFMLIAHRTGVNLKGARNRAEKLADQLGYKLYSSENRAKNNRILVGRNVTKSICAIGAILWIAILLVFIIQQT